MRIVVATSVLVFLMVTGAPVAQAVEGTGDPCSMTDINGKCPESSTDDVTDTVVTEGVQFPNASADSALGRASAANAQCSGCEWKLVPACVADGPQDERICEGANQSCSDQQAVLTHVYFRPSATAAWQLIDSICLGPSERPASVADVGELVRERVVTYLPDADPSFQPADGGIVNLPTIFAAGEPDSIETEPFDVLGFTVVVTATARWEWTFEPGTTTEFTVPGGAYPDDSVSHTYRRPGERDVSVTTYWSAEFTVDGQGPFAVPGPEISKTVGPIAVNVRQAGSQLVGG
jgi:hypothetical protein